MKIIKIISVQTLYIKCQENIKTTENMEKHGTKIIYSYYFEILSYFNFSFSNSKINVICGNITKEKKKIYSCNTCNEKKRYKQ